MSDFVSNYTTHHSLRSAGKGFLAIRRTNSETYGDKAFSVAGPELCNTLPLDLKAANSVDIFTSNRKTFLFEAFYSE